MPNYWGEGALTRNAYGDLLLPREGEKIFLTMEYPWYKKLDRTG